MNVAVGVMQALRVALPQAFLRMTYPEEHTEGVWRMQATLEDREVEMRWTTAGGFLVNGTPASDEEAAYLAVHAHLTSRT